MTLVELYFIRNSIFDKYRVLNKRLNKRLTSFRFSEIRNYES
jgi:hypothetical protein